MIGIVVVSHSPALANAAVELASEMAGDAPPRIRVAAGAAGGATGTDAVAIAAAIDEAASPDGVLVVTDLGSAILSAEMSLEFRASTVPVRLSAGPFVEGLIAAVVSAGSGASLDDVEIEARGALEAKRTHVEGSAGAPAAHEPASPDPAPPGTASFDAVLCNPSGLHARPAALFVKTVARHDARVQVRDLDTGKGPVSAKSLVALMALGVGQGAHVRIDAEGTDAAAVLDELRSLIDDGFGET